MYFTNNQAVLAVARSDSAPLVSRIRAELHLVGSAGQVERLDRLAELCPSGPVRTAMHAAALAAVNGYNYSVLETLAELANTATRVCGPNARSYRDMEI